MTPEIKYISAVQRIITEGLTQAGIKQIMYLENDVVQFFDDGYRVTITLEIKKDTTKNYQG